MKFSIFNFQFSIWLLFLPGLATRLPAQSTLTGGVLLNSGSVKSNWVASSTKLTWRSIAVNNAGAADQWIMVFDSATNKLNNAPVELVAFKVLAGTTGYFDAANGPVEFKRGLNIAASSTPVTLTNDAAATVIITVIRNP